MSGEVDKTQKSGWIPVEDVFARPYLSLTNCKTSSVDSTSDRKIGTVKLLIRGFLGRGDIWLYFLLDREN